MLVTYHTDYGFEELVTIDLGPVHFDSIWVTGRTWCPEIICHYLGSRGRSTHLRIGKVEICISTLSYKLGFCKNDLNSLHIRIQRCHTVEVVEEKILYS